MPVPLFIVDAFTAEPFAGNPAGVCLLDAPAEDRWMQRVAAEVHASETAFLLPREDGYGLRWFTPEAEVDLCGHATLASAHVLWEAGRLRPDEPARFRTRSGLLTAARRGDWIEMDFPAEPAGPAEAPPELARALGDIPLPFVGRNRLDLLAEVESEEGVRKLAPEFELMKRMDPRGIMVTARSSQPEYDFVSRFFAPGLGVPEDPVTGSAHCALGPYWGAKLGKEHLVGRQVSARGGVVRVQLAGDRVLLGGQAVTVVRGELLR